jgi:hypothetical protein
LTPAEVVTALGQSARLAARADAGEISNDYSRGQLLSAFSTSRHLTVELQSYGPELRAFADDVAGMVGEALPDVAAALRETGDAGPIGELTCRALETLRGDDAPAGAAELRMAVHARLRVLAEREVDLLAEAIERKSRR